MTVCSLWTREPNIAARNGVFYGWTSEIDCMTACLRFASCVAIDVGHVGCVLHNNINDLSDAYNASGVTQFLLHRDCLRTSPRPTTTAATVEAEYLTKSAGKLILMKKCFSDLQTSRQLYFFYSLSTVQ